MGAKVVTCLDSTGWVYDPEGIDLAALKEIKEVKRGRVLLLTNYRLHGEYHSKESVAECEGGYRTSLRNTE